MGHRFPTVPLNPAHMDICHIKIDGINELMEKLKLNLKEGNKAVVKSTVLLIGTMAEAAG